MRGLRPCFDRCSLATRSPRARARPGGAQLEGVVGQTVESVSSRGKHLLIDFSGGLTLHTHLGLHGAWHRYRRGERWRRSPVRAVAVLEADDWVAVAFDAPTVELLDTRAVALHPALRSLGSDASGDDFDVDRALVQMRDPSRGEMTVGDALLDQHAVAGLGNVYRSEVCFIEKVNPLLRVADVDDEKLRALLERGHVLLQANSRGGARVTTVPGTPGNLYVYGRTGRACLRCGTPIRSTVTRARDGANPRRVYWCPACQA